VAVPSLAGGRPRLHLAPCAWLFWVWRLDKPCGQVLAQTSCQPLVCRVTTTALWSVALPFNAALDIRHSAYFGLRPATSDAVVCRCIRIRPVPQRTMFFASCTTPSLEKPICKPSVHADLPSACRHPWGL